MYPVLTKDSDKVLVKYNRMKSNLSNKFKFIGRLSTFKYLSIDGCVEQCLELMDELKKGDLI